MIDGIGRTFILGALVKNGLVKRGLWSIDGGFNH